MTTASTAPALVPAGSAEQLLTRALSSLPFLRAQVTAAAFAESLERSVASRFRESRHPPARAEVERYLESLHLADLALACACAAGSEAAWDHFVRAYRPELYAAARAVAREANPHELADSIYSELFGLDEKGRARNSLFRYFHGRSKLSTWLRAVVAQRFVDQVRASRRVVSLAEEESEGARGAVATRPVVSAAESLPDLDRARLMTTLQQAAAAAIVGLEPRDRLRLSYYYIQDLTLAQIGRLTGESEATVSRKLDRTRADLRKRIEQALREENLSEAQVALCFDYAREAWPFDLSDALSKGP